MLLTSEWSDTSFWYKGFIAWRGWFFPAMLFLLGLAPFLLSTVVDASCLSITLLDSAKKVLDDAAGKPVPPVRFGFWQEPNHGLAFLVGVPFFAYVGYRFIVAVDERVRSLSTEGRLVYITAGGTVDDFRQWLSGLNQKLFLVITPLILLTSLALHGVTEWRDYTTTERCVVDGNGERALLGWVQADLISHWAKAAAQGRCLPADNVPLYREIARRQATPNYVIQVSASPSYGSGFFRSFLVVALVTEAIGVAVAFWIAAKMFLVTGIFFYALRGTLSPTAIQPAVARPVLVPKFDDIQGRYGLSELFAIYRILLVLVAMASLNLVFSLISNTAKGTSIHQTTFSTQFLNWGLTSLVFAVVIVGPWLVAYKKLESLKKEALKPLYDAYNNGPADGPTQQGIVVQTLLLEKQKLTASKVETTLLGVVVAATAIIPASFINFDVPIKLAAKAMSVDATELSEKTANFIRDIAIKCCDW